MASINVPRKPISRASQNTTAVIRERGWIPELPDPSCMLRLVRLPSSPPNALDTGKSIELAVTSHYLEQAPEFQALSYTWACPYSKPDEIAAWNVLPSQLVITCNGQLVPVSRNLFQALKQMMILFPGALFWTDALCIDQLDDDEKAVQIQLMGEVYTLAENVVAWLGSPTIDVKTLSLVQERFEAISDAQPFKDAALKAVVRPLILPDTSLEARRQLCLEIWRLCDATWWKRTWTFQEHVLAQSSVLLVYGRFSIRCRDLRSILELIPDPNMQNDPLAIDIDRKMRGAQIGRIKSAELLEQAKTNPKPLIDALDQWQGKHNYTAILLRFLGDSTWSTATLPQDHVLSLLGACKITCQRLGQPVENSFLPLQGSYHDFMLALAIEEVTKQPRLCALRLAGIRTSSPTLPSWLPDFRQSKNGTISDQQYDASFLGSFDESEILAGRDVQPVLRSSPTGLTPRRLGFRALKVGTLQLVLQLSHNIPMPGNGGQTSAPLTRRKIQVDYHVIVHMLRFLLSLPSSFVQGLCENESLSKTLFFGKSSVNAKAFRIWASYTLRQKTSIHRQDKLGGPSPSEQLWIDIAAGLRSETACNPAAARAKLAAILGFDIVQDLPDLEARIAASPNSRAGTIRQLDTQSLRSDLPNDWEQELVYIAENRVGVTIKKCQLHDQVWILQGSEYPVILRPTEEKDQFRLVGDVYVGGIMNGEFVRDKPHRTQWSQVWIV